jgi:GNAT superfamily N-acetyltransferase
MLQFHIRKLGTDEISFLQFVGRATYEPYYPHVWYEGGLEWYMDRCFNGDTLRSEMADPNIEYLLATDASNEVIGFMKLVLLKPMPEGFPSNALFLEKIYLMPNFFGQGVGRLLIDWVVQKAARIGREAVWLNVMKNGPVQAYLKSGFEITGVTRWEFDLLRTEERDGLVMVKKC